MSSPLDLRYSMDPGLGLHRAGTVGPMAAREPGTMYHDDVDGIARIREEHADAMARRARTVRRDVRSGDRLVLALVVIAFAVIVGGVVVSYGFEWGSKILEAWK